MRAAGENMKVWIDITSFPHARFFKGFAEEIEKKGNEVLITCRKFYNLEEFLKELGLNFVSVGSHGKTKKEKLIKSCERIKKLTKIISEFKPDICIAKHSVELPRVAFGLGISSILVLDHETAEAQTRLTVPFADIVVSPKAVPQALLKRCGAKRVKQFYGVCEVAHFYKFKKNKNVLKELGINKSEKIILARSESRYSSHNIEKSFIFRLLREIKEKFSVEIIALPRNNYDRKKFKEIGAIIPEKPIDTLSIYFYVSLVISAGSTMNREASLTGANVLSICPDSLPAVDKFLIKLGLMKREKKFEKAFNIACSILEKEENKKKKRKVREIISKFENPYKLLYSCIREVSEKH